MKRAILSLKQTRKSILLFFLIFGLSTFILGQLKKSLLDVNEEVAVMSDLSIIESLLIPKSYDGLSALLCSYLGEARSSGG